MDTAAARTREALTAADTTVGLEGAVLMVADTAEEDITESVIGRAIAKFSRQISLSGDYDRQLLIGEENV